MSESQSDESFAPSAWGALASLALGYGAFAAIALRYLYPRKSDGGQWQYVIDAARLRKDGSLTYTSPSGATVAIACQGDRGNATDFVALSSTCPHLGCKVHWEGQNNRFFCPCHNGAFDPSGSPIAGPPAEANQPLPRFPLEVRDGLVYIQLPSSMMANATPACGLSKPGHDQCLGAAPGPKEV